MSMNFGIAEYWYDLYDFLLENTLQYSHSLYLIFAETIESLSYIFATDSVGLAWFKFLYWAPTTHLFCNRVHIGRSRSSKVTLDDTLDDLERPIKVDEFGTIRKRICDFLIVRHSNLGPILHRFWDMLRRFIGWKLQIFLPCLIWRPRCIFHLDVRDFANHEETRVIALSLQWRPHDCSISDLTQCRRVTDVGRTDRQTDRQTDRRIDYRPM